MPRERCARCERPSNVCLCPAIPEVPLETSTKVIVLQHPKEKRALRTVPYLKLSLDHCSVITARKIHFGYPDVEEAIEHPDESVLLFPRKGSQELHSYLRERLSLGLPRPRFMVVIDCSWSMADKYYAFNKHRLSAIPAVKLSQVGCNVCGSVDFRSAYSRIQPQPNYLSTLEAVALALDELHSPMPCAAHHQADGEGAPVPDSADAAEAGDLCSETAKAAGRFASALLPIVRRMTSLQQQCTEMEEEPAKEGADVGSDSDGSKEEGLGLGMFGD